MRSERDAGRGGRRALAAGLIVAACVAAGPRVPAEESARQSPPTARGAAPPIDRRSYELGIIGAFAEVVNAGVKTLALSEVMTPEWCDGLIEEAERIATRNHVLLYRESDFLVTDLFPAPLTAGKHVLLIYKGDTLAAYRQIKADKAKLEGEGRYHGEARAVIARRFGRLLSYPDWKIDELLREKQ